jgi:hypothetical protein
MSEGELDALGLAGAASYLWLDFFNYWGGPPKNPGMGPGPGVAQIHVRTAREAEEWFAKWYRDREELQLTPISDHARLAALLMDDGSINYAAGILRKLADDYTEVKGPHPYDPLPTDPAALDDLSMQLLYEAYRAGFTEYDDNDVDNWRRSVWPGTYGPLIVPYLSLYRSKP